jgi:hypothetical protein
VSDVHPRGVCSVCRKPMRGFRDRDGFGHEKPDAPLRAEPHAGARWGRMCKGSHELMETTYDAR